MSENSMSRIIRYFRDCYQSDSRSFHLNNFFSSQIESGRIISGDDDILNGRIGLYPLTDKYGSMVEKDLLIYGKEKGIYLFSFFVTGQDTQMFGKTKKLCAPLFIHPAKIVAEQGLYYLNVDFDRTFLNQNFLGKILSGNSDGFYKAINEVFLPGELNFEMIGKMKRVFEAYMDEVSCEELLHYPKLLTGKAIKAKMSANYTTLAENFIILPTVGYGVMKKSDQTRGILEELDQLIDKPEAHSTVLRQLFSGKGMNSNPLSFESLPEKLTEAQMAVLKSVSNHTITQVTGPPGTGKSFTISALAAGLIAEGKSVLVTAKTDEAVNVVAEKITTEYKLGKMIVRSTSGRYRSSISRYLGNRLNSVLTDVAHTIKSDKYVSEKQYNSLRASLEENTRMLSERLNQELKWGEYLSENKSGIFHLIKKKYLKWRMKQEVPYWKLVESLFERIDLVEKAFRKLLLKKYEINSRDSIDNNRQSYVDYLSGLKSKFDSVRDKNHLRVDFTEIFKTVPVWLCKITAISKVLPMRSEMFDVAIVDEASQCDIATMLPILQRAKKLVVVGDPRQLRHISFISRAFSMELMLKYELPEVDFEQCFNYRDLSILDFVNNSISSGKQIIFLNEHYRSNPDIISFSNKEFYDNSLTLMTDHPSRRNIVSTRFIDCNGERNAKGFNEKEAQHLIGKLRLLINTAEANEEPALHSIGVLSPFRAQVDHLAKLLTQNFSSSLIKKYKIICGTAYSFQGEERDIMFLSMCVDANSHSTAFRHLNKPDVFNVAITRAKHKQFVFLSLSAKDLKQSIFQDFLLNDWHKATAYSEPDSNESFIEEVSSELAKEGIVTMASYPIAGRKVDILCKKGRRYFGINLIGYPGEYEDGHDVDELKLLYRSGLSVFPLPYSYWYFDREACLKEISSFAG
ncbi:MAG: AAA domain-containing protein [Cyclobacteriaceae bacterium]